MTDSKKVKLPHEEVISASLLLKSQTLTEKIIGQLRQKNNESGLEIDVVDYWGMSNTNSLARKRVKAADIFIEYEDSRTKKNKLRWLSQAQNQRSGQFYTLENLIQNNVIGQSERDLFEFPPGVSDFPYRQIYQFHRIKRADGFEYFSTHEQWTGISRIATVVTISVSDIHWYIKPTVRYELRNTNGSILQEGHSIVDNKTVQIATTRMAPDGEPAGQKVYITKFTPEVAYSALKLAHGSIQDPYNGCSLNLIKEGIQNPRGAKDPKLWAEADFDKLFEDVSRPPSEINMNVDPQKLADFMKYQQAKEGQGENQYQ